MALLKAILKLVIGKVSITICKHWSNKGNNRLSVEGNLLSWGSSMINYIAFVTYNINGK
jgi:hypothetical protein